MDTIDQMHQNLARLVAARHIAANHHHPQIQHRAAEHAEDLADEAESIRRAASQDLQHPTMDDVDAIERAEHERAQHEAIAYPED